MIAIHDIPVNSCDMVCHQPEGYWNLPTKLYNNYLNYCS